MDGRIALLVLSLLALSTVRAFAAPGDLDPSFGSGGIVTADPTVGGDWARDGAVLPDGRIVVCGIENSGSGFLLARFLPSGALDTSFGVNGFTMTSMPGSVDAVSLARQPDGKLVVAGSYFASPNHFSMVTRYDSSGTLDPGFGTNGKVGQVIGPIGDIQGLVIQPDGMIVIVGSFRVTGSITFLGMRRYDSAGVLDASFGIGGTVTRGPGTDNHGYAIALQPDGKLVAAGGTDLGGGLGAEMLTFRFKPNGSPDSTFATFGRAITTVSPFPEFAGAVAVVPGGRILVGGHIGLASSNTHRYVELRFSPNGTLDPGFGSGGIALTPEMGITTGYAFLTGMLLLPSGRSVMSGQATNLGSSDDFALACMDSTGAMDPAFGNGGAVYSDLAGGGRDIAFRVIGGADGKLVAVGSAGTGVFVGGPRVGLVRYLFGESVTAVGDAPGSAGGLRLDAPAPNPLLTRTRFSFSLARSGEARLEVRDVAGRSVIVLAEGALAAGVHSVAWDGRDSRGDYVRPGVYFARLEARPDGERLAAVVRRIVVLR